MSPHRFVSDGNGTCVQCGSPSYFLAHACWIDTSKRSRMNAVQSAEIREFQRKERGLPRTSTWKSLDLRRQ